MATFVRDTFTAADGTSITARAGETGATWTANAGGMSVAANRVYSTASSTYVYASGAPSSPDYEVSADFTPLTGWSSANFEMIFARGSTSGSGPRYGAGYRGTQWTIDLGGAAIAVSSTFTLNTNQTYRLRLRVQGTTLTLFVDDVQVCQVTDGTITTAGRAGFRSTNTWTSTTGGHWDNLFVADIGDPAPASSYTLTGPSSGVATVASSAFTVTPNGTSTATVTPATTGTGTFTPTSVTFDGTATAKTFTYTPASATGSPHTISVTNNGGLTNPSSLSYTVNSALARGACPAATTTAANVSFTAVAPAGGNPPYTYQWQRAASPALLPQTYESTTAFNLSGQTSLALTDAPPDLGLYWYQCRQTDSAGAVVNTRRIAARRRLAVKLGFISSSTFVTNPDGNGTPVAKCASLLAAWLDPCQVTAVNEGKSGSSSADWVPGAGSGYLATAKTNFAAAGVTHVLWAVGANDGNSATWLANTILGINDLAASGYKVILCGYQMQGSAAGPGNNVTLDNHAAMPGLANGKTIFCVRGYRAYLEATSADPDTYLNAVDILHPSAAGRDFYGFTMACQAYRVLADADPEIYWSRQLGA